MSMPETAGEAPSERVSLQQVRRLLGLVLRLPRLWVLITLTAAGLSAVHVSRTDRGGWTLDFRITGITAALVGLTWLPPVVRLIALAGGALRSPAGEATTPGLLSLLRSLDPGQATVPEFSLPQAAEVGGAAQALPDVRQATALGDIVSYAPALVQLLQDPTAADYAVVDLGGGNQWLTSRLFLFADLLERMRGLRAFVFVQTEAQVHRRFIGSAATREVRWALATEYPWLDSAYAKAYAELPQHEIRSTRGALDIGAAGILITNFLQQVQVAAPPAGVDMREWVGLSGGQWEHAQWLGGDLPAPLRTILDRAAVKEAPDASESALAQQVLAHGGATLVGLVGPSGEFVRLVDRLALLEQTAARLSQASQVVAAAV